MDLGLGIVVSLKDMLSRNSGKVEHAMEKLDGTVARTSERMTRNLERIQKGTMMAGAGLALLATPIALLSATAETHRALGELASLGVKDLRALENAAESFTNAWAGTTKAQFITSAYDVRSALANLSDEAVGTFTAMAALAAKATKATTDEMVGTFTTSYGIFKPLMKDMSDMEWARTFAGGMAQTVASFKTNGKQMADAIKNIGAVAASANVPMEEQLAILGQLQTTMPGSEAGTLYKAFIMKAAEAGDKLGVSMVGADGRLKGIIPMLEVLRKEFPDFSQAATQVEIKKAFGSDEAVKFLLQMSQGLDGLKTNIQSVRQAMETGTVVTEKMARAMNQDIGASFEVIRQQIANLMEILGRTLLPIVTPVLKAVSSIIMGLQSMAKAVPGLTGGVLALITALGAFLVVVGGIVASIGAVGLAMPAIKAGIAGFGAALAGAGSAIASAFLPVTATIAGVVAAIYLLKKAWDTNFGGIREMVEGAFARVRLAFRGIRTLIRSLRGSAGEMSAELAQKLKASGLMGFVVGVFKIYYRVRQFFAGFHAAITHAFSRAGAILGPAVKALVTAFVDLYKAGWSILEVIGIVSSSANGKAFYGLGEGLGMVLGLLVQVGAFLLKVIIYPIAFLIKLVGYVVKAFVWLGKSIVKGMVAGVKAIYTYFLPLRLVVQAFRMLGRMGLAMWDMLTGGTSVLGFWKAIGKAIWDFLGTPFRWVADAARGLWRALRNSFANTVQMWEGLGETIWNGLKNTPLIRVFSQLLDLSKVLQEKKRAFFNAGKEWILSLAKGIWSAMTAPIQQVKKGLAKLRSMLSWFGKEKASEPKVGIEQAQAASHQKTPEIVGVDSPATSMIWPQRFLEKIWTSGERMVAKAKAGMASTLTPSAQRAIETARALRDQLQSGFGAVTQRFRTVLQEARKPFTLRLRDTFIETFGRAWEAMVGLLVKRLKAALQFSAQKAGGAYQYGIRPVAVGAMALSPILAGPLPAAAVGVGGFPVQQIQQNEPVRVQVQGASWRAAKPQTMIAHQRLAPMTGTTATYRSSQPAPTIDQPVLQMDSGRDRHRVYARPGVFEKGQTVVGTSQAMASIQKTGPSSASPAFQGAIAHDGQVVSRPEPGLIVHQRILDNQQNTWRYVPRAIVPAISDPNQSYRQTDTTSVGVRVAVPATNVGTASLGVPHQELTGMDAPHQPIRLVVGLNASASEQSLAANQTRTANRIAVTRIGLSPTQEAYRGVAWVAHQVVSSVEHLYHAVQMVDPIMAAFEEVPGFQRTIDAAIPVDRQRLLFQSRQGARPNQDQVAEASIIAQTIRPFMDQLAQKNEELAARPIDIIVKTELDGREIAEAVYRDIRDQKIKNYETF
ncbi:Phage tail tape measure protein [Sulfidibacter corallicola]|uniref:Phage tail tape measure protein n=1 Tax=Sulfidibacter corallicola TaxID=2818388 RepID=A0A8A4TW76_SULCO|nr:phage tail tape measure protein [Sulfidibacter corallicola]QTD54199.1 phage tail tape measure protein [Sulfidibacter corallicola]